MSLRLRFNSPKKRKFYWNLLCRSHKNINQEKSAVQKIKNDREYSILYINDLICRGLFAENLNNPKNSFNSSIFILGNYLLYKCRCIYYIKRSELKKSNSIIYFSNRQVAVYRHIKL